MADLHVAHDAVQSPYAEMSWQQYQAIADRVMHRFEGHFRRDHFLYNHPDFLQPQAPERFRKTYSVRVGYYSWGDSSRPLLMCLGGVANVARRFSYLGLDLKDHYHVVCPDWVGRGESGWMADQGDYNLGTYVEQTRQLIAHLGAREVFILGSSMGGSVAIELASAHPGLVQRLILNDIGPYIAAARRVRRAQTLARHYVFRTPAEMFRKTGAAQKNDGPASDDARLNGSYGQTRWSDEEGGRVYRHDLRALLEYQRASGKSVRQWAQWERLDIPILVIRGNETDALLPETLKRMQKKKFVTSMHIPFTGHTPTLSDPNHIACIGAWLRDDPALTREFSSPYAPLPPGSEKRTGARPLI